MENGRAKALYVYVHPEAESFNRQLFETGLAALKQNYDVEVSDLYAMGFQPVLADPDLGKHASEDGTFLDRWSQATKSHALPSDVLEEQRKLREAELIVFQFPLWWYSVPAMLKGWIDRVFSAGFGFDVVDPATGFTRKYGDGLMLGKRALIVVTFGETEAGVGPRGRSGDLDSLLFSFTHGTLFYTGMEVYPLHPIGRADDLDEARVVAELSRFADRLAGLAHEAPSAYRPARGGDYLGQVLRPEIAPGRSDLATHRSES